MVPCIRISEARRDEILQQGFNRPPESLDSRTFVNQLRSTCDAMQTWLSLYWQYGIGDGDFFIHEGSECDQMLCVEIAARDMLDPHLLVVAHKGLVEIAPDYCVDYCNALGYLRTDAGEWYPEFNVFVSKDQVLVYSQGEDLIDRLSLTDSIR